MAGSWRLIENLAGDVADVVAMPAAVAEGRIAGRYIMTANATPETVILQRVTQKGIIAGSEVVVDKEEAARRDIDVVRQGKAARGSLKPAGTVSLTELMAASSDAFEAVKANDAELSTLIYTSGTTGKPKGVMLTHTNFVAECEVVETVKPTKPDDRFASLVPYFHVFGLADACVLAMYRGNTAVLIPQYHPRTFLKVAHDTGVNIIMAIPSQYHHLILIGKRRSREELPTLEFCFSGAAPLPPRAVEAFREVYGIMVTQGFGMTETTSAASVNPAEKQKVGSIGVPCPGVEMKIFDDDGVEQPPGRHGEIAIKGPIVTSGYYNLPEETALALENGWLRTGDIGYRDDDGYFFITDRKKDIIIKGGYNISPREIEDTLTSHDKIKEAAVVGFQKKDGEDGIRAYCVVEEGQSVSAEELMHFCRKSLSSQKTPDDIRFMGALPRSATGKVLRKELREGYSDPRLITREHE
ncbi:MAG: AMP-binding protein [Chitinivibrionales bacterium]|nr:AMP-binding protein [Chitinivibrionales bacterium]MBD3395418.1 AMP-binding protein [Chitinivibrionales bacterium]